MRIQVGSRQRATRDFGYNPPMRNVVFVAPFPLETTMRFARAAAALGDVRFLGIMQESPHESLFADLVTVRDGLDAQQLVDAARLLERLPHLPELDLQRQALSVAGTSPETADLF